MTLQQATAMNNFVRQYLCQILRTEGGAILDEVPRFSALLRERCAEFGSECNVLLLGLHHDVHRDLIARHDHEKWDYLLPQLSQMLVLRAGLDADSARWAVESWRGGLLAAGLIKPPVRKVTPPVADRAPPPSLGSIGEMSTLSSNPEPSKPAPLPSFHDEPPATLPPAVNRQLLQRLIGENPALAGLPGAEVTKKGIPVPGTPPVQPEFMRTQQGVPLPPAPPGAPLSVPLPPPTLKSPAKKASTPSPAVDAAHAPVLPPPAAILPPAPQESYLPEVHEQQTIHANLDIRSLLQQPPPPREPDAEEVHIQQTMRPETVPPALVTAKPMPPAPVPLPAPATAQGVPLPAPATAQGVPLPAPATAQGVPLPLGTPAVSQPWMAEESADQFKGNIPATQAPAAPVPPAKAQRTRSIPILAAIAAFLALNVGIVGGVIAWKKWKRPSEDTQVAQQSAPESTNTGSDSGVPRDNTQPPDKPTDKPTDKPPPPPVDQEEVKKHVAAGTTSLEAGMYDQASEAFQKALDLDPRCVAALVGQGDVALALAKQPQAVEAYSKALEIVPDHELALLRRGLAQYRQGNYHLCLADCTAIVTKNPNNADAYNNRGACYLQTNENKKALAEFNLAIQARPDFALAIGNRGRVYYRWNDYDQALTDFEAALKFNKNLDWVYNLRGWIYYQRTQYTRAVPEFSEAIKLAPRNAQYLANRALVYLVQNNLDKTFEDCNAAINTDNTCTDAYGYRAVYHMQRKLYDRALEDSEKAIKLNSRDCWPFYIRGLVRMDQGKTEEAITDFRQALTFDPFHEATRAKLAGLTNRDLLKYLPEDTDAFVGVSPNYLPPDSVVRKDPFLILRPFGFDDSTRAFFDLLALDYNKDIEQVLAAGYRETPAVMRFTILVKGKLQADLLSKLESAGKLKDATVDDLLAGKCAIYEWESPEKATMYCALVRPNVLVYSWSKHAVREAFHRDRVQGRSSLKNRVLQRLLDELDGRCALWLAFSGKGLPPLDGLDPQAVGSVPGLSGRVDLQTGLKVQLLVLATSEQHAAQVAEVGVKWRDYLLTDLSKTGQGMPPRSLADLLKSMEMKIKNTTVTTEGNLEPAPALEALGFLSDYLRQRAPKR